MPSSPFPLAGRFSAYFNHGDTADVKMVIEVVQSDENLARRQLQLQGTVCETANADLRAHSVILMCNSPVWKAQLERWQRTNELKKIIMIVEEGEQAAAYKLVECLYTDSLPDLETEGDLRVNLGILMLADQYQVKAAISLCVQKLDMLTNLGAISWTLANRVMRLPSGYLEKPGFSCLLLKIQEKILQHAAAELFRPGIGLDLEVVMRNSDLEAILMALPLRKCASLLSDNQCRVASENTVAAAVVRRVNHEQVMSVVGKSISAGNVEYVESAELRAQIMADVIRIPHLSPLFAVAMPTFASQLASVMPPEVYALGRELGRFPIGVQKPLMDLSRDHPMVGSWLCRPRAPSTVTALEFDLELSAAELADRFDSDSGPRLLARSPMHFFAGMHWDVELQALPVPDNVGCRVHILVFGEYPLFTAGPLYGATINIHVLGADKKSSLHYEGLVTEKAGAGWTSDNVFPILPMQKWDQSRMQKWTSSKGLITVRVKVSDVM